MALIINTCRGKRASMDVGDTTTVVIDVIASLMAGVVDVYEQRAAGGTDVPAPSSFRTMKFGLNRKIDNLSCTLNIKHVKTGKDANDILAHKALFDANYETTLQATGMRMVYGGVR